MNCPNCQYENLTSNAKFCPKCGFAIPAPASTPAPTAIPPKDAAAIFCKSCDASLKAGTKFCPKCGTAVPAPAPIPQEDAAATFCKSCGASLKTGTKFCPKCGAPSTSSALPIQPDGPKITVEPKKAAEPQITIEPKKAAEPQITVEPKKAAEPQITVEPKKAAEPKKKSPILPIASVLIVLLLAGGGVFALYKAGFINLPIEKDSSGNAENTNDKDGENTDDKNSEDGENAEVSAELEEKLKPISETVAKGEEQLNAGDPPGASQTLTEALNAYAALVKEYDSDADTDAISADADSAFALYTKSILTQTDSWESQPPTPALHMQIYDITLQPAYDFGAQLKDAELDINTDELDNNYNGFHDRYKIRYITAFNDEVKKDDWSRTTAWQYMQDAASVGLVDTNNPDDPLTLRYAFALAWYTQRELESETNAQTAISAILSCAQSADYNPKLMRMLADYYTQSRDTYKAQIILNACAAVCDYLANSEAVFINPPDLVPGRNASNAASTIALKNFWYFNDFGDYAPTPERNGVSAAGRTYIRDTFKQALSSL